MVLYADVLFIIDFSMDVLTLWAAGRLTHSKLSPFRTVAAASFGGIVSVCTTVLGTGRNTGAVVSAVTAFIMSIIAFGFGKAALVIRRYIFLWLGGVILGGVMTALMSVGRSMPLPIGNESSMSAVPAGAALLFILITVLQYSPKDIETELILSFNTKLVKVTALCDSGNRLTDPFSGEAVILIDRVTGERLFSEEELSYLVSSDTDAPSALASRVRLVPSVSLGGESLLKAVRIHNVVLKGKSCAALVALTDNIKSDAYSAIVPSGLL